MAVEQPLFKVGFMEAAADLSAKQYCCVKVTADAKVNVASVAGEKILAVLQDKPKAGSACELMCIGVTKLVAGAGGLAAGNTWETAADGTGIACTAAKVGNGTVLIGAAQGKIATVTLGFATGAAIAA